MTQLIGSRMRFATPRHRLPMVSTAPLIQSCNVSSPARNLSNTLSLIHVHTAWNGALRDSHRLRTSSTRAEKKSRMAWNPAVNRSITLRLIQSHTARSAGDITAQATRMSSTRSENHEATTCQPALIASNVGRSHRSHRAVMAAAMRSHASLMTLYHTSKMKPPTAVNVSMIAEKIGDTMPHTHCTAPANMSHTGLTTVFHVPEIASPSHCTAPTIASHAPTRAGTRVPVIQSATAAIAAWIAAHTACTIRCPVSVCVKNQTSAPTMTVMIATIGVAMITANSTRNPVANRRTTVTRGPNSLARVGRMLMIAPNAWAMRPATMRTGPAATATPPRMTRNRCTVGDSSRHHVIASCSHTSIDSNACPIRSPTSVAHSATSSEDRNSTNSANDSFDRSNTPPRRVWPRIPTYAFVLATIPSNVCAYSVAMPPANPSMMSRKSAVDISPSRSIWYIASEDTPIWFWIADENPGMRVDIVSNSSRVKYPWSVTRANTWFISSNVPVPPATAASRS